MNRAIVAHDELTVAFVAPGNTNNTAGNERFGIGGVDAVIEVDRIPCDTAGEPDTGLLLRAGGDGPRLAGGTAASVAAIWREVLRVDTVDLSDDLFDLGGHSLSINQMSSRIESRLGVSVPLTVFYDSPTIIGITAAIQEAAS
jgi:acyl carrier protein